MKFTNLTFYSPLISLHACLPSFKKEKIGYQIRWIKREAFTRTCPNVLLQEDQIETVKIVDWEARQQKIAKSVSLVKLPLQIENKTKKWKSKYCWLRGKVAKGCMPSRQNVLLNDCFKDVNLLQNLYICLYSPPNLWYLRKIFFLYSNILLRPFSIPHATWVFPALVRQ